MKTKTLFLALVAVLLSCTVAFADTVRITIESYANPALGVKSTVIETTDPYDPNDTADQLEMSILARDFALSPEGWDLAAHGFGANYVGPGWSNYCYSAGIQGDLWQNNKAFYDDLLGFQTIKYGYVFFHTDLHAARAVHCIGESPDNYGVISGTTGGTWMYCPAPDWGQFTVELVSTTPTLEDRVTALEEALGAMADHEHDYLTGKGQGHNNTPAVTGPPK